MSDTHSRSILPGAEPFSAAGGTSGALVLHGFTGCPQSMRPLAEAFAATGFTVELPLLPGHGTSVDDMLQTRWDDWAAAAEVAYTELASRCDKVVVAGLSMGGTLAAWLAATNRDVRGLVAVNPLIDPPADSFRETMRATLDQGIEVIPAVGNDVADPAVDELAYDGTPVRPLLSVFDAMDRLNEALPEVRCPVLVITSKNDHVVPPVSSDVLAERVSGPVERVFLDRSFHVATIDYDRDDIAARATEFARKVTAT